jgi:hypothetical protein
MSVATCAWRGRWRHSNKAFHNEVGRGAPRLAKHHGPKAVARRGEQVLAN